MVDPQTAPLKRTVGTFSSQAEAEAAHDRLRQAGFSEHQVSIDTQHLDPNPPLRETEAKRSAMGGAIAGAVFGVLAGLVLTLTARTLPGETTIGPVMAPAPVILIGAIAGMVAGGLIAAITGASIPKPELQADRASLTAVYLVTMQGSQDELVRAADLLVDRKP